MIVSSYVPRRRSWKWPLRCLRYVKLILVRFIVLCRRSVQLLFVLRTPSSWMWRRLLVRVSGMVTSLVAMDTGHHTPCAIVKTEVGLRVKSQVGFFFFACHGNQISVGVVDERFVSFPKRSAWLWGPPRLLSRELRDYDLGLTTHVRLMPS